MKMFRTLFTICWFVCLVPVGTTLATGGKLLGTSGLTQLEGSGGGGIVPWATIAGYDTQEQISASAFMTQVNIDDYRLQVAGANLGLFDRVELSIARQTFDLRRLGGEIRQNIIGAKIRVYGDIVYSDWPQIALGAQYKRLHDPAVADLLGAENSKTGFDYYVAATKVHLGLIAGYNFAWNVTARATEANQLGLLGFGGTDTDYQLMLETSAAMFLTRKLAVGFEYRQKPDNLVLKEDDWFDIFLTYMPSKHVSFTLAWAELGNIAVAESQQGIYFSITGAIW